ncbi:hypothetical protein F7725_012473 [Dissostichus mawsoni]|uniref:Uncharacterized protein n=1 Tax=Dissostichus mawsoni TaxID=36200 RepID=A0A7J5YP14_DISMA|nr:hypothetical protein F7725_012473 [Dissostichus mawsoni]
MALMPVHPALAGLAVDAIGGDLPPVGHVLADLGPVAVPLAPLAVGLGGRREAHLVLLREEEPQPGPVLTPPQYTVQLLGLD